ncbi:MAG: glycosyl transferase family 90 [Bacteroidota bacterium]
MSLSFGSESKALYYLNAALAELIPPSYWARERDTLFRKLGDRTLADLQPRVDYYNKLAVAQQLPSTTPRLDSLKKGKRGSVYYYDARAFSRSFPGHYRAEYRFGDVTAVPPVPAFLKSRPIAGDNANSVLLKFNRIRHFRFVNDPVPLHAKMDQLIGMAAVNQENRRDFYRLYFDDPRCILGQINRNTAHDQWYRKKISIRQHLNYRYILCLEGYDVASNLKWVMSSNSLAVMPEPTYETWFMEGTLKPGVHYVPIRKDFSDLHAQLDHYSSNPALVREMVAQANAYTKQFMDADRENAIAMMVMEKYFRLTGQY